MCFEWLVVLRNIHGEAEVALISRWNRSGNWMAECPAQSQASLVRKIRRLIPAFRLRMIFLTSRPYGLGHALQRQDAHVLLLCAFQNLRPEVGLCEEHKIYREKNRVEVIAIHGSQRSLCRVH